jgi:cystathionine beta-lyase/cystathionine gamma-synthase
VLRISIGLEDPEDLWQDIARFLDRLGEPALAAQ